MSQLKKNLVVQLARKKSLTMLKQVGAQCLKKQLKQLTRRLHLMETLHSEDQILNLIRLNISTKHNDGISINFLDLFDYVYFLEILTRFKYNNSCHNTLFFI